MRSCAALIANLTPFRGVSMDAGTAFEVGFMRALGRPVAGYTNAPHDYRDRSQAFRAGPALPFDADRPHVEIEDFGLAENLMIEIAIAESGCTVVRSPVAAGSGDDRSRRLPAMPGRIGPNTGPRLVRCACLCTQPSACCAGMCSDRDD